MPTDALTAPEAAALLGVSRETLYAYVSRGLVASEPGPGPSRARRYPRAAIEALVERRALARDRGLAAHGALSWGLPVLDSELTLIEDGRCYYRGHDAVELARTESVERVAALLWTGEADAGAEVFAREEHHPIRVTRPGPSVIDLARHLVTASEDALITLGAPDQVVWRGGARVVCGLFAAAGAVGDGRLAERLARGWGVDDAAVLEAALILCADHELNVSSFTARCVASADASLENVVLAALCALGGRRHGGLTDRVEALVREADRDGAAPAAARALGADGALAGFGHPLYPDGDPRAVALLDLSARARPDDRLMPELVAVAAAQLGVRPTLDFGLVALARSLRLPDGAAFCLFALGRSVGWIAHALETRADGRLIRPRARYTGRLPRAPGEVGSSGA